MATAYGYLRKSTVRDPATETSAETQERLVRELAARNGDTAITIKADWDVSGAGRYTNRRAGYLELVDAIETGRCSAVYSYSLSRLGRSVQELSRLFDLCKAKNVPLRLVADSVDTSTASGMMTAVILAAVAQFESEVASERQNARNMTKRLAGESLRTRKRYGERDGEDVAAVMAAFRAAGSYDGAAKMLNASGVLSRDGKPWWGSSVAVVVKRLDPAILSTGRGARAVAAFELSRLLVCPTCTRYLTGGNTPQRRYACRAGNAMTPHPKVAIAESKVLPWVKARMTGYVLPGKHVDSSGERQSLEDRRTRAIELRMDDLITRGELTKRLAPINAAMAALDQTRNAPESVDWTAGAGEVNRQLRTLLRGIMLKPDLTPDRLIWHAGLRTRWTTDGDGTASDLDELVAGSRPIETSADRSAEVADYFAPRTTDETGSLRPPAN